MTTRDYLNTLFFYRRIAVTVFLWVVAIGFIVTMLLPPTYRADARLLTLFAGYYSQSNATNGGTEPAPIEGQLVSIEAQILNSPELHRAVVTELLGPEANASRINDQLDHFERHFHLEQDDLASVVTISYIDSNPKRASDMLNRLLAEYFHQRASIFTSGRASSLIAQRDAVRAKLDKLNVDIVAFQKRNDLLNIDDQINHAIALHNLLKQRKLENDNALAQDRSTFASLVESAESVSSTILLFRDNTEAAHTLDTMQLSLLQLEARRADLAARYLPLSPFVRQIDQQLKDVSASIAKQKQHLTGAVRYGHNTFYDTVQDRLAVVSSNIKGEAARQRELQTQLVASEAGLQTLIGATNKLSQMFVDRTILTESLRNLSHQVDLASIDQIQADTASSTNVRVIQAPVPPAHRNNPIGMFIAASIISGLMASALTVLVLASLRETFLSPEQVERALLLPVLSAPITPWKEKKTPRRNTILWSTINTIVHNTVLRTKDAADLPPYRPSMLLYGRAITAIDTISDAETKLVMMISFDQNDGLASVIQGLATELVRRSSRPILIIDLASTQDVPLYGQPNEAGMLVWGVTNDAPEQDRATIPDDDPHLHIFVFEPVEGYEVVIGRLRDPAFHLTSQQAANLFALFRKKYDYVIIHAPPARSSFMGVENARLADATLLIIRAEKTRKPIALGIKTQIQETGGQITGIILTDRKSYIPDRIYRFL
ncbi:GumC family protein [Gluconacetobacter asukensis]|uniref:Lipopolysaccharide biosynthesis protein n=1 Tax=Gluconacetobacter asukensis TaxID=1017181 RepID=A0A7W4P011_9PROT|nr:hypothetical protein [Gluconacetobacter asukensis]MBB2172631.1 hypothetical protein [Gluconacetobacter asukensis]